MRLDALQGEPHPLPHIINRLRSHKPYRGKRREPRLFQFLVTILVLIHRIELESHRHTLGIVRISPDFLVSERVGTILVEQLLHRPQNTVFDVVNPVLAVLLVLIRRYPQPTLQVVNHQLERPFLPTQHHVELQRIRRWQRQGLVQLEPAEALAEVRQHPPDLVVHLYRDFPSTVNIRRIVDESADRVPLVVLVLKRPAAQVIQSLLDVLVLHLRVEQHRRGRQRDSHILQPQVQLTHIVAQLHALQSIRCLLDDSQHHPLFQDRHVLLPRPAVDERGHHVLVRCLYVYQFPLAHASSSIPNMSLGREKGEEGRKKRKKRGRRKMRKIVKKKNLF